MYLEPLRVLYEKSNIVEFVTRMLLLIIKPKIAQDEDLQPAPLRSGKGVLRFGLWDLYLSAALMLIFTVLLDIVSGSSYVSLIKSLKQEILIPLEFAYYAFWYTGIFFVVAFCLTSILKVIRKQRHINVVKQSYILMLQYARVYGLLMFLFYFVVIKMLNTVFTELVTLESIFEDELVLSYVIGSAFFALFIHCLVNPIRHYLNIIKYRIFVYPLVIFLTILPLFYAHSIPSPFQAAHNNAPVEQVIKSNYQKKYCP